MSPPETYQLIGENCRYLEDGIPGLWFIGLITKGDPKSLRERVGKGPLPNGRNAWLINGG